MKVIVNRCFGGYGFSHDAIMRYAELSGFPLYFVAEKDFGRVSYFTDPEFTDESYWSEYDMRKCRTDPLLIQVIEEMGDKANGRFAALQIVDIPDGVNWHIEEYDGSEHIAEDHRTWC